VTLQRAHRILVVLITIGIGTHSLVSAQPAATATFEKPAHLSVNGGICRDDGKGTFGVAIPGAADAKRPYLAFSIGPATFMADESHASKAPFHGAGSYKNVLASGNASAEKPAVFAGLATVTVNADGKSGTFALNDHTVSAAWQCGAVAR
jgi:hypothetical protein